jgi:hypothetical protein
MRLKKKERNVVMEFFGEERCSEFEEEREMNYRKLRVSEEMLKGNINRMCVTDDEEERLCAVEFAKKRIDDIYGLSVIMNEERKGKKKCE